MKTNCRNEPDMTNDDLKIPNQRKTKYYPGNPVFIIKIGCESACHTANHAAVSITIKSFAVFVTMIWVAGPPIRRDKPGFQFRNQRSAGQTDAYDGGVYSQISCDAATNTTEDLVIFGTV